MKKIYGAYVYAANGKISGQISIAALTIVSNDSDIDKDLDELLYKTFPLSDGWLYHKAGYQAVTPDQFEQLMGQLEDE